jgi:Tol biopolymer transport system component
VALVWGLSSAGLALAPNADAIYGPTAGGFGAEIVSVDNVADEQANAPTTNAVISADGRYVVFQTRATNFFEDDGGVMGPHGTELDAEPPGTLREGGIFRYDRETGAIQLVADGTEIHSEGPEAGKPIFRGADNPSVSADGRYVVFATAQQLVPQDKNDNVDVYVRDMDVPLTANRAQSGAYTLVSAENGGEEPATYDNSSLPSPLPGGNPGSEVWPGTSISADGRYVVFRSAELASSLPTGSSPTTPPDQLFVRDLQAKTITLVTRTREGEAPAGGANGPASISADGSTVAWLGSHAPSQTIFLQGETLEESLPYYMWQRWSQAKAPTRRLSGISDPEDPECPPNGEVTQSPIATGPCYGPLTYPEASLTGLSGVAPSMSADGNLVAFLAGSSLRPDTLKADSLDIFTANMGPGVDRKQGTAELTLAVNGTQGNGNASIDSLAMSSDGTHIAFVTQRNAFVLSDPAPLGSFPKEAQQSELYVIDRTTNTLERAVVGSGNSEPNGSALGAPSISAGGSDLAFVSAASNLTAGDANGVPDAFVASLQAAAGTAPASAEVNTAATGFSISSTGSPELGLRVRQGKDGSLLLLVETPGPGKLTARAFGSVAMKGRSSRRLK